MKEKKSKKLNLIICAIAFLVMIFYLIFVDGIDNVINSFKAISPLFLVLGVVFMVGYWLLETWATHIMCKALHKEQKFSKTWFVSIIGQYFNCITPFASGGQPIQAYYLVKFGMPLGSSMTALLSKFIVYQFVLTIYSIATLIIGFRDFGAELEGKGLMIFVFIGFIINSAVIAFLIAIACFKKGTLKLANGLITLLAKIHIVKNPLKVRLYFNREVSKFYNNFQFIKKNVVVLVKTCLITFLQLTLYLSISYLIYLGFGFSEESLFKMISYQAFVLMISSFVPLPGAMGAAELSYAGFFKDIFGQYTGVSTMIWRIFTFYLPILVGLFFTLTLKEKGIDIPDEKELPAEYK